MTSIYIASASETLDTLPLLAVGTVLASPTYWVDKLVVALLLLGFGLWTKVTLERSKSKLALKNEMAKQRIPIIASTWSSVYRFEADTNNIWHSFISGLQEHPDRMKDDEEIAKLRDELVSELQPEFDALAQQAVDLEQELRGNRFWLGEWLYERHYEYLRLIEEKNDCFLASEFGRAKQIDKQLLATRQSIDSYL